MQTGPGGKLPIRPAFSSTAPSRPAGRNRFSRPTTVLTKTVIVNRPARTIRGASPEERVYRALVLGLRDYLHKCGFHSAVLGVSGGIDSAVVACLAVAALGPENVRGLSLPSQYSSAGSLDDAQGLAANLRIQYDVVSIQESFKAVRKELAGIFARRPVDTTEENIQARLRGVVLMAMSNKFGSLLLTTRNKRELAVGYCTLQGARFWRVR